MKNEILKFIKGKGVKNFCRLLECATYFRPTLSSLINGTINLIHSFIFFLNKWNWVHTFIFFLRVTFFGTPGISEGNMCMTYIL